MSVQDLVRPLLVQQPDNVADNFRHLWRLMSNEPDEMRLAAGWYAGIRLGWAKRLNTLGTPEWNDCHERYASRVWQMPTNDLRALLDRFAAWAGVPAQMAEFKWLTK